jgi:hypothetical protein
MSFAARHIRRHRVGYITTTISVNSGLHALRYRRILRLRYHRLLFRRSALWCECKRAYVKELRV